MDDRQLHIPPQPPANNRLAITSMVLGILFHLHSFRRNRAWYYRHYSR